MPADMNLDFDINIGSASLSRMGDLVNNTLNFSVSRGVMEGLKSWNTQMTNYGDMIKKTVSKNVGEGIEKGMGGMKGGLGQLFTGVSGLFGEIFSGSTGMSFIGGLKNTVEEGLKKVDIGGILSGKTGGVISSMMSMGGGGKGIGMGGVAGGVAGGMIIVDILKQIVGFVSSLEPIKAVMKVVDTILTLFFMPLAMMIMMMLMPVLQVILGALSGTSFKTFISEMEGVGKIIGDLFASFISVFGSQNLLEGMEAMMLIIAAPAIAATVAIIAIITSVLAEVKMITALMNKPSLAVQPITSSGWENLFGFNLFSKIFGGGTIRHYQAGGYVPSTGLAMLEAGETVVPAGMITTNVEGSPVTTVHINMTNQISSKADADAMIDYIFKQIEKRTNRVRRW